MSDCFPLTIIALSSLLAGFGCQDAAPPPPPVDPVQIQSAVDALKALTPFAPQLDAPAPQDEPGFSRLALGTREASASAIREDGRLADFVAQRYSSYDSGIGEKIESRSVGLKELEAYALENGEPEVPSGRQEFLENLVNEFI